MSSSWSMANCDRRAVGSTSRDDYRLTIQPGVANTVMGTMGTSQKQAMGTQGVYLPRFQSSILQYAGRTTATTISVDLVQRPSR